MASNLEKFLAADGPTCGQQAHDLALMLRRRNVTQDVIANLLKGFSIDDATIAKLLERAERKLTVRQAQPTSISPDFKRAVFSALGLSDGPTFQFFVGDQIAKMPQPQQIVLGRMQARSLFFAVSPSGAGKTLVEASLSVHIGAGATSWHGAQINPAFRGQPVVYALAEGQGAFQMRVRAALDQLAKSHGLPLFDTIPDSLIFLPRSCRLDDPASVEAFVRGAEAYSPCMVVLDTYQRHGGAEGDVEKVQTAIAHLDLIKEALQCTVNVPHHLPKDGRTTPRGHGSIDASADTVMFLERKGELITASFEQRDLPPSSFVMQVKAVPVAGYFDFEGQPATAEIVLEPSQKAVKAAAKQTQQDDHIEKAMLKFVELNPGVVQSELLKAVKGKGCSAGAKYLVLVRLRNTGQLLEEERPARAGKVSKHYTLPPTAKGPLDPII